MRKLEKAYTTVPLVHDFTFLGFSYLQSTTVRKY